jgi:peptidyl-prolyl cis-trans isomerase B (cyclophilin B)
MSRRAPASIGLGLTLAACAAAPTPTSRPACPAEAPTDVSAQATIEDAEVATLDIGGAVDGQIVIELFGAEAPLATANFVALARCGFYDGVTFHRVIAGFVIQAGDPQTKENRDYFDGLGTGGPGYQFEIEPSAEGLRFDAYTVAMANAAPRVPDSNGSQFFIDLVDLDEQLRASGVYTIFGRVTDGTDTVDAIGQVPVNHPRIGVPNDPVIIESISISAAPEPSPGE